MNTASRSAWDADMARIHVTLEPYIREDEDGWAYIDPSCPKPVQDLYSNLVQFGYANGFMP